MASVPRSPLVRFAQLAAVWAYAVSQPVFSFLGGNPDFVVLRQPTTFEALAFAVVLAFGLPLAAVAYAGIAGLVSRWVGAALFLSALAAFLVPLAFQVVKPLEPTRGRALLMVVALCAIGVVAYARLRAVRLFLAFSFVLPVAGIAWYVHGLPTTVGDAQAAQVSVTSRVPVVVLVLDEFPVTSLETPRGRIDSRRYPNFGRLASDATWYPNATTVYEFTSSAVPAILTGKMPTAGKLPTHIDHPENLFTFLGGSYAPFVHEAITRLCPDNYCPRIEKSLPRRIDEMIGDVRPSYVTKVLPNSITGVPPDATAIDPIFVRATAGTVEAFEEFVEELSPDVPSSSLHFDHLVLPHFTWRFLPSGRRYGFEQIYAQGRDGVWQDDPWAVQQQLQRHLVQVQYVDTLLGQLLRRLERIGLYDRALLVVVADHGASFRPGRSLRGVGRENFGDIASVPLFVKYPGQERGAVDLRAARTIDILPTIADVLGARLPWRVDGVSLRGARPHRVDAVVGGRAGFVRAPLQRVEQQDEATLRRNARLFGQGSDSLFRIGMHKELLGLAVGQGLPDSTTVHVRIEDGSKLANVRKASSFVPAHIAGVVDEGQLENDAELAIAVNGRIRALTRCVRQTERQRFYALVPESAFVEGFNRVEVFAIDDRTEGIHLMRLGASRGPG